MSAQWYVNLGNRPEGPISSVELKQWADQGKVTPETPVRKSEDGSWSLAGEVRGLFDEPAGSSETTPEPVAAPEQVTCPHCGKRYPLREDLLGRRVKCKACGTEFVVSRPTEVEAELPPLPSPLTTPPSVGCSHTPPNGRLGDGAVAPVGEGALVQGSAVGKKSGRRSPKSGRQLRETMRAELAKIDKELEDLRKFARESGRHFRRAALQSMRTSQQASFSRGFATMVPVVGDFFAGAASEAEARAQEAFENEQANAKVLRLCKRRIVQLRRRRRAIRILSDPMAAMAKPIHFLGAGVPTAVCLLAVNLAAWIALSQNPVLHLFIALLAMIAAGVLWTGLFSPLSSALNDYPVFGKRPKAVTDPLTLLPICVVAFLLAVLPVLGSVLSLMK